MLPFMFVTNRVNYSRWLPVYILDMFNLAPATNDMLQTHKPLNLNFGKFEVNRYFTSNVPRCTITET